MSCQGRTAPQSIPRSRLRLSLAPRYPVCENCPHFSTTFYYTVVGVANSVFMMAGSTIFKKYMYDWTYHGALCISQLLMIATGLLDIIQYQRWNLLIGIPDWVFMLGKNSVQACAEAVSLPPSASTGGI